MFQDDGVQVLSVDVSTSTHVVYLTRTLIITTNTPFLTRKMYNLTLDSGVCVGGGGGGAGATCGCVCVYMCIIDNYVCLISIARFVNLTSTVEL